MSEKDGGWGWVIVCACCFSGFLVDGIGYSYGLIFVELLDEFNESKAFTAGIGSVMFGMALTGPLAGMLINRYGCRLTTIFSGTMFAAGYILSAFSTGVIFLYFSIGILLGFGFTTLELTRTVIIVQYFDKRRSLARGLSVCGSGIGAIVFNPLSRWLIDEYGWRGTLLIEGGLALNTVVCGLLMRPITQDTPKSGKFVQKENIQLETPVTTSTVRTDMLNETKHGQGTRVNGYITDLNSENIDTCQTLLGEITDKKYIQNAAPKRWLDITLFKNPHFLLSFTSLFFIGIAYFTPFTFIPEMAVSSGWTRYQATWLMTAIGITITITRMVIGLLLDVKCMNRILAYATINVLVGIIVISMPFCKQYVTLMTVCILFGCLATGHVILYPLVAVHLFGEKLIADTQGLQNIAFGIGSLIAGPLSGAIFDVSGNYTFAFITVGIAFMLSGILYLPMCKVPTNKHTTSV